MENAYNLIVEKLTNWLNEFIALLPNLVLAALILVLGMFLAKFVKSLSLRGIRRVSKIETVNKLFASFMHVVTVGVVIFIALSVLKLDKAVTSILAGAGIVGLALAFAFQDVAANFMAGIFMSFRRPLAVDDLVKVGDYFGTVEVISLRDTSIITLQGQRIIIPNKDIFQNPIENYTSTEKRRLDLYVGVSYGDDLEKVKQITLDAAAKVDVRDTSKDINLFYTEFGDSSINFLLTIWLTATDHGTYLRAQSDAIMLIKQAYDDNDITIPFPIRTLDFGIKGGEKLSEMQVHVANGKGVN